MDKVELIISANGCTDNTWEYLNYLATVLKFKLVWNKEPLGYPKAVNEGLKIANCNKIVLLNNDTVLLDQPKNSWLERLDGHDIAGVLVNYSPETKQKFAVFFCVMIDRRVFSHVGLLNEEYGVGGGEDIEFCAKAIDAGFELHDEGWRNDFPIYHVGEGTVHDTELVEDYFTTFTDNMKKLAAKYE
jgi:GT2 family glycosyltransferase